MPTTPERELVADVADQFEQLQQPLNAEWAKARRVSLDELQALGQQIALILRGYLALSPHDQIAFVAAGIFTRHPPDNHETRPKK